MSRFDELSVKNLKKLLISKSKQFNEMKKKVVIGLVEKMKEKDELIKLVKAHVKLDEISELLALPDEKIKPTEVKPKHKPSKKEKEEIRKALNKNPNQPSAEQLKKQASQMRRNPDAVRRANPMFAKMSNKEIFDYADQIEKAAKDPAMFNEMMKMSQMPEEEKDAFKIIQEGFTGKRERDDSWIEATISTIKKKPDLLKMIFKGKMDPKAGITDDHIEGFIDYIVTWSDTTLKFAAQIINYLVSQQGNISATYKKVDDATLGCAKYIIMAIVFFMLYVFARIFWFLLSKFYGLVMMGYASIMNKDNLSNNAESTMESTIDPGMKQTGSNGFNLGDALKDKFRGHHAEEEF